MINLLLEPFSYDYMLRAFIICIMVGAICGLISSFLMLKGLSLMGDALAHAVVPGVVVAHFFAFPYMVGAFFTGIFAALSMEVVKRRTKLKEDAVIGVVFTGFLALGLVMISARPTEINVQKMILGDVSSISPSDAIQIAIISLISLSFFICKWRDIMLVFFDEGQARAIGLSVVAYKIIFFIILSATTVTALQSVGAAIVISMVITPGATAYLLTNNFAKLVLSASILGAITSGLGVYIGYFADVSAGGIIILLQSLIFAFVFIFAPKYGLLRLKRKVR
ncbi:MAG: metal ABC transporter permease [Alphaproteobacteria bacterium]